MPQNFPFNREDVWPSWIANRFQDFLSAARTDLRISKVDATKIAVIPDPALGIAAVAIDGRWRFITAEVQRQHPGGAKGTWTVWAVATDNDIDNEPDPFTDHTDYAFALRITNGENPSGAGVEVFEKIGEIDWSGTEIEAIRQTHNAVTGAMLANDALPSKSESDVEWVRQPGGGYLLQLKADSVGSNEIAAGAVAASEVADSLKPSGGAAAGTEALRALGTSGSTAAAGNDSRLSDERTPKDNSVNSNKIVNGSVTRDDLASTAKPMRWYTPKIINSEQHRKSTSFGTLSTADEITNVELPTNGLIVVIYRAEWRLEAGTPGGVNGHAAIFLNEEQLRVPDTNNGDAVTQEVTHGSANPGYFALLTTYWNGLNSNENTSDATGPSSVTTGMALGILGGTSISSGGPCYIWAAAGTYTVSVRYRSTNASYGCGADERKLWVGVLANGS